MAAGVITLGRNRYAVGLYWENNPGSGRVAQTAREAARQLGQKADFFAVRPGNNKGRIAQFGLTNADAGQKPGMPALAPCLASQLPGSWAGAFRVNEGIIIIIVRDDLIVPDGDLLFLDENEARDRLIQEIGFGGLTNTYAPEAWSIPGADTIPLALLLNDVKDIKLQQVEVPPKLKLIIAGSIVGLLLLIGGGWYWQEKIAEEKAEKAAQEAALARAREEAAKLLPGVLQQTAPPPKYVRVWEDAPPINAAVENCRQGLKQIPAALLGWKMASLKCNGNALLLTWSREKGVAPPPPQFKINDQANAATETIALAKIPARGFEELIDPDQVTSRYLLQNWPGTISRVADDPPPPPPPDYKGPWNPPPPPWVKRSFTFSVPQLPGVIPMLVGALPGAMITNMVYSGSGVQGSWQIEGVIYENRK